MTPLPWIARIAVTSAILAAPLGVETQPSTSVARIGFLEMGTPVASAARVEAFQNGLRALGYTEGRNVKIEWRFAEGKEAGLRNLAAELVTLKPDVLVSTGIAGIRALRVATTAIPIVMAGTGTGPDAPASPNLSRPGGNVTGVLSISPELEGKRMELLREAVPTVSRVATFRDLAIFPYRAGDTVTATSRPERWGFAFIPVEVRGPDDFGAAFTTAVKERAGALSLLNTPLFYTHRRLLADLAVKHGLAWIAADRDYAEAGCLISYGADGKDLLRRAATYVDRLLKGAKPANLPIEQPTRFELVVNLRTAKALGLTIPPSVLVRADDTVQ